MEPLGQADVCDEILPPVGGARPAGVLRDHLTPQLLGNAQALQRPEASDALSPVRVLDSRTARQSRDMNSRMPRVITASL